MKQINHTLQQKLAEFKAKSGMNQTQLARGIGTSCGIHQYVSERHLCGKRRQL